MAHIEVPHRLSDAIEAFKVDLNRCLHTSGTLASLKECLKQHLSTGRVGSQCWRSDGSSLPDLAHCITAEYLESAQLKFTLPAFLSETCRSTQSNPAPTSQSILEQLGIGDASSFGRAFASYAPGQLHESSQGREESLLLGLLRTIELLHGNAGGKERHQTMRGPTVEPGKQEDRQRSPAGPTQGPPVLASDHKPSRHLVYQLKAALGLIRALRMELHTGQHLSGLLLRELYRAELDQGRYEPDAQPQATRAQRIASLQDTLLRQQKRVARLEREEAALLQEPDQPQPAPSAGRPRLSSCADAQPPDPAGDCSRSDASSLANSSSACPGCLSERSQHARRAVAQQAKPSPARSGTSSSASAWAQSCRCTEPLDSLQGDCLGSARSSSATGAAALVPSSRASPTTWEARADDHPCADGGTAIAAQGTIKQAQPVAACADLLIPHGSFPGVEAIERGIGPGSMPTGSTEKARQTALCGGYPSQEGDGWELQTGHSSRSSSVPLQESVKEENDAHDQIIEDGAGAESRSSLNSGQHSTRTPPASRLGSLGSAISPSGDAAALLQGASPEPATLSPARAPQQARPSRAGSASHKEQRPSGLGMSPPREQLPQQPERRQSYPDVAGCSAAEPSASAWAGHSHPAALPPQTQHAFDSGASTTAIQQAQGESHCKLSSQQNLKRELIGSCGDDLSSTSRDSRGPVQERDSEDRAKGMSPEEDELSRRMRSFLARLPDDPAPARSRDSAAGLGSALSLQAARGSEGMSDRGDDPGDEQAHEEGQGRSQGCLALQGPGQVQLRPGDVSRSDHDGSEPSIRCGQDVCTPAAPDAACSITVAGRGHTGTGVNAAADRVTLPVGDTLTATVSPRKALEGADVGTTLSVSPAYSMLPWDKPGMWPSTRSSVHSLDPHTGRDPSTEFTGASLTASAAHTAPVAFLRQPSRLSVTLAGEEEPISPVAITSDTRPSSLRAIHDDSRWHMQALEATSAQHHQHDDINSWAPLLGSTGSAKTLWARDPFANSPGTASVGHFQQDGTAAQKHPLSDTYRGEATPSSSSAGMHQEHPQLSKEAFVAELLGHMHGPRKDSHLAFPAHDNASLQGLRQLRPDGSADQAAAWERHASGTSYNGQSADAEMQSLHHWLSMHGYSDAAVHVTATLAEAVMPSSVAESDIICMKNLSPVGGPPPVYQEYTDRLSGAVQQSFTPCSPRVSGNRREGGPAMDTSSALQTDVHHEWQGTPSSGTIFTAESTVSAAGVAQERINVQGVALSRTMPSIWDLDS